MQTPGPLSQQAEAGRRRRAPYHRECLAHGRHLLNEVESKALLAAFHIPIAQTQIARNPMEAMLMAQQMGFPVAMKINSPDITTSPTSTACAWDCRAARRCVPPSVRCWPTSSACAPTPPSTASWSSPWRPVRTRARSAAGHDLGPGAGAGDRVRRRRRRCRSLPGSSGDPAAAEPLSGDAT